MRICCEGIGDGPSRILGKVDPIDDGGLVQRLVLPAGNRNVTPSKGSPLKFLAILRSFKSLALKPLLASMTRSADSSIRSPATETLGGLQSQPLHQYRYRCEADIATPRKLLFLSLVIPASLCQLRNSVISLAVKIRLSDSCLVDLEKQSYFFHGPGAPFERAVF